MVLPSAVLLTAARPTDPVVPKRARCAARPTCVCTLGTTACAQSGASFSPFVEELDTVLCTSHHPSVRLFDGSRAGPRGSNHSNAIGEMIGAAIWGFGLHACMQALLSPSSLSGVVHDLQNTLVSWLIRLDTLVLLDSRRRCYSVLRTDWQYSQPPRAGHSTDGLCDVSMKSVNTNRLYCTTL